jgi:hypothetical protein
MENEFDKFDEFLQKIHPLMDSSPLYRSLDFACVGAKLPAGCVLISGRATLSTEAPSSGEKIIRVADLDDLLALRGRLPSHAVNNLITNLRQGWVIDFLDLERIITRIILPSQKGRLSWIQLGVFEGFLQRSPWKKSWTLLGQGPGYRELLANSAWERIDTQLRRNTPAFGGFDALCEKLGLTARRNESFSISFPISAELPGRFVSVGSDSEKGTLEVQVECRGWPELMIDWLPEHDIKRIPPSRLLKNSL